MKAVDLVIPMGISFYMLEAISYLVDIRKNKINPEKDFILFAAYLSFFPNLISGPIERADSLLLQLKNNKRISADNIKIGIQIMAFGFFKKMVLADRLGVFVDDVFENPNIFSSSTILLAVISYSIQIYMDFSGYSDIAVGCARCIGINFKENFNFPYLSQNISDFWRRWHISLSSWFRDYVYIPLGGNKKSRFRLYINLLIVMTLSGFWHGANWNYIFWGFTNGILLCIDKVINKNSSNSFARWIFNFIIVSLTWILFRSSSISNAVGMYKYLFRIQNGIHQPYVWSFFAIIVILFITLILKKQKRKYLLFNLNTISGLTLFLVFVGITLCLAYTNPNPFVYFKF